MHCQGIHWPWAERHPSIDPNLPMKAIIIGTTGATGQALLPLLLASPQITQVDSYGRRSPAVQNANLHVHTIDLAQPQTWADTIRGDMLFCCLGTTLKAAGSQDAQWKIDYQAPLDFARAARAGGVKTLILMSAAGADAESRFFYTCMKGQLEQAITALEFPQLLIFRPPLLIRPGTDRAGEIWSARILRGLNAMGLLRDQRPLPVEQLAQAMLAEALDAAARDKPMNRIFAPSDIRRLLEQIADKSHSISATVSEQ